MPLNSFNLSLLQQRVWRHCRMTLYFWLGMLLFKIYQVLFYSVFLFYFQCMKLMKIIYPQIIKIKSFFAWTVALYVGYKIPHYFFLLSEWKNENKFYLNSKMKSWLFVVDFISHISIRCIRRSTFNNMELSLIRSIKNLHFICSDRMNCWADVFGISWL